MMKILISACLMGCNCKYNGNNNLNSKLVELIKREDIIMVCPEQLGGLATPRPAAEIKNGIVYNEYGKNVNDMFLKGAKIVLDIALKFQPDLVILKARSPSCGVNYIYDGNFCSKIVNGNGICADLLLQNHFNVVDDETFLNTVTANDFKMKAINLQY